MKCIVEHTEAKSKEALQNWLDKMTGMKRRLVSLVPYNAAKPYKQHGGITFIGIFETDQ